MAPWLILLARGGHKEAGVEGLMEMELAWWGDRFFVSKIIVEGTDEDGRVALSTVDFGRSWDNH